MTILSEAPSVEEAQEMAALQLQEGYMNLEPKRQASMKVAVKKSPVWVAIEKGNAAALKTAAAAADAKELGLKNEGLSAVQYSLENAPLSCTGVIVRYADALGYPEAKELAAWKQVQAARAAAADPEAEDPPDVNDEEWQATLATSSGLDKLDVKKIVAIGLYAGGRAAADPNVELSFDGELQPREGFGIALSATGDVYVGGHANGARGGKGALHSTAGGTYVGEWQVGKRHGTGRSDGVDGSYYEGAWQYNKRHGRGTYCYPNGDQHTGEWFAGKKHGAGRYRSAATGAVTEGTWQHGELKAAKVAATDGSAFYGRFDAQGRPQGGGAYVAASGAMVKGAPVEPAKWAGAATADADHVTDGVLKASLCGVATVPNVIICGAPASGKGTQCEKIVAAMGLVHISTGDMLRAATNDPDNEFGQLAKEKMEAGELVPDEVIFGLVQQRLTQPDCMAKGWLLDGFPRTGVQATMMEENFLVPTKVVVLDVPNEVLVERVTGRRLDPETGTIYHLKFNPPSGDDAEAITARLTQRADDTEEALVKRLETFAKNQQAVEDSYAALITKVDGNRATAEVWADVLAALR